METKTLSQDEMNDLRKNIEVSLKVKPLVDAAKKLVAEFGHTDNIPFTEAMQYIPDDFGPADLLAMCRVIDEDNHSVKTIQ